MILDKTLTVDTGMTTAWALWKGDPFPLVGQFACSHARTIRTSVDKVAFMAEQFDSVLSCLSPDLVILEMAELWDANAKSHMAGVLGDLFQLTLMVGAYLTKAKQKHMKVELLPARAWKGQLSKEATAYRVQCINGLFYESEHITDAVGIGFSRDYDIWHLKKNVR